MKNKDLKFAKAFIKKIRKLDKNFDWDWRLASNKQRKATIEYL